MTFTLALSSKLRENKGIDLLEILLQKQTGHGHQFIYPVTLPAYTSNYCFIFWRIKRNPIKLSICSISVSSASFSFLSHQAHPAPLQMATATNVSVKDAVT
uniref:Uncharacterized protein n=1 Tax=Micrurus spixii TaxID=129469 RepID=A0A2D4MQF4_9SAUR